MGTEAEAATQLHSSKTQDGDIYIPLRSDAVDVCIPLLSGTDGVHESGAVGAQAIGLPG